MIGVAGERSVEREVEAAEVRGVCDEFDPDDLAASDRGAEGGARLATRRPDESGCAIDEARWGGARATGEAFRYRPSATELRGEPSCADRLPSGRHLYGRIVGAEKHVRVEDGEKCIEVAAARGGEEGVDDLSPAGVIGGGG